MNINAAACADANQSFNDAGADGELTQRNVSTSFPRQNNLEWLRLIFAVQVVLGHCHAHLSLHLPKILTFFPGVPAFFFVSGFLIYASHKKNGGVGYWENRFLRIFPALVFVTIGGLAVVIYAKGFSHVTGNAPHYLVWFIGQITLGQGYNPEMFRDIGVGVINGSLWTITTEILFYGAVPIVAWLERYFRHTISFLTAVSFAFYAVGEHFLGTITLGGKSLYEYFWLTPVVWGWMFGFGMLAFKHYAVVSRLMRYLPGVIIIMLGLIWINIGGPILNSRGQELGVVYYLLYVLLIFYAAFGTKYIKLPVDLSYGIYIWHMPLINLMLVIGLTSPIIAMVGTAFMSAVSWFLVEKPALRLKRQSMHRQ